MNDLAISAVCAASVPCATSEPIRVNYNHTDLKGDFTDCPAWRAGLRSPNGVLTKRMWDPGRDDLATRAPKLFGPGALSSGVPRSNP